MFPVHFYQLQQADGLYLTRFPIFSLLFLLPHLSSISSLVILLSPLLENCWAKGKWSLFITKVAILPIILHSTMLVCLFILEETEHQMFF